MPTSSARNDDIFCKPKTYTYSGQSPVFGLVNSSSRHYERLPEAHRGERSNPQKINFIMFGLLYFVRNDEFKKYWARRIPRPLECVN